MMLELAIVGVLLAASVALLALRSSRAGLYRALGEKITTIAPISSGYEISAKTPPGFSDRIVVLPTAISTASLERLTHAIEKLTRTERSYLPSHKKGGTIAYETLVTDAPDIVAFYQSTVMIGLVSDVVGVKVVPTPLHDQSSCSVLVYEKPGDHIGWHYDHNFYRGRHFTVLLAIVNRGQSENGLSAARLMAKVGNGERSIATPPNTMVIFEGARVVHKVTPIVDGERRVMLSMT